MGEVVECQSYDDIIASNLTFCACTCTYARMHTCTLWHIWAPILHASSHTYILTAGKLWASVEQALEQLVNPVEDKVLTVFPWGFNSWTGGHSGLFLIVSFERIVHRISGYSFKCEDCGNDSPSNIL